MKKSIIILIFVLAAIVVVSPGIVGKLAEESVDESLNRAAQETREVVVTSQKFDRGWFSSEGQHRVEFLDGEIRDALMAMHGTDDLPVLIIDTRIDHGLIPVTSMTRDKGSLAPGLGSAVSTLKIENADGEIVEMPGTIYSSVGLAGGLTSNYVLEGGTLSGNGTTSTWGPVDIVFSTDANATTFEFDGTVDSLDVTGGADQVSLAGLRVSGEQYAGGYGFMVGDIDYELESMTVSGGQVPITIGPMELVSTTRVEDGKTGGEASFSMTVADTPNVGDVGLAMDVRMAGVDAAALQAFIEAAESLPQGVADPTMAMGPLEPALKQLLAGGAELHFDKFNMSIPQGTIETTINLLIEESGSADFEWTSLLLATEAEASIRVPEPVMDFITGMNPQAGAIVGMGYLKKNGDVYEMDAAYKKGLLTINGAPMPIPMP